MTDEERTRWRELKASVSAGLPELRAVSLARHSGTLSATDPRIVEYLDAVTGGPGSHNLYELLGARRFLGLMDRYGWNAKRVRRFFRFYESLRFSGVDGRRRYRLTPVQCFQFASIFGFDNARGHRLTRTAYLFVPRKFSKTTSTAALAVYDLLFGDNNAQAYVGANSYDQAKICFDEIRRIMSDIDPRGRHVRVNREKIFFTDRSRNSTAQCLTANARTKDGLNASMAILDEYAQARNSAGRRGSDLKNVLTSSMGARAEPLTVVITTASDVLDGPFYEELQGVMSVLRGEMENDTMFASLFMPDADDDEGDPRTWSKVQPHLGVTVQPDFYERAWADSELSQENKLTFRTKLLNVFCVDERKSWFDRGTAYSLLSPYDFDKEAAGQDVAVAFDLSVRDDFSAVAYSFYSARDRKFFSHVEYYFPEGSLEGHPNRELYARWAAEGHLRLCPGRRIDVARIADDIIARSGRMRVIRIGYDSYKAQELTSILASVGGRSVLAPYSQTHGSFNLPTETFEMMAYSDPPRIVLSDNPINAFCLENCVINEDSLGNKKPYKVARHRKIDGVIAVLMTLGQLYTYER